MEPPLFSLRLHLFLFLLNLLICIESLSLKSLSSNPAFGNETDRLALLAFKTYLVDGPNGVLSSWNDSLHFCQWQGVICSRRHQRVTVLQLNRQSLVGSLPPSIGNLSFLRQVDFSRNKLQGTIPKEIGRLFRLQYLYLSENSLGGEIPLDLTNCSNLQQIDLSYNSLTGEVPFQIGFMLQLSTLSIGFNSLIGGIPSSLGNLSSLTIFSLTQNRLEGSIPADLGRLKSLMYLHLGVNNLSGMIPSSVYNLSSSLGNLSSLTIFSLTQNRLEGSIPADLGRLKSLMYLHLGVNNLSGMIPSSVYNLSSLISFSVPANNLSGNLMPNIGLSFPNLYGLYFGSNQFTGTIPATLSNISGLEQLDVGDNNLRGQVPNNFGVLKHLWRFGMQYNSLGSEKSGDLSFLDSLTNCSNLIMLNMNSNQFGGLLPNSIVNLSTQLTHLYLGENKIYGSIPDGIGNLISLTLLVMEMNYFTGAIPTSIGKLQQLGRLSLATNRLSGFIPSTLGNLTRLFELHLGVNNLKGSIPSSLKNCRGMQILSLAPNGLSGSIPTNVLGHFDQLRVLELSKSSLAGSFPVEVGNLKNLQWILIDDNKLSGKIPSELGSCLALEYLIMAGNLLEGNIPPSLNSLRGIRILDLSRNNLSGRIPKELQDLSVLESLNLSFNHLEGEVPTKGVFKNVSEISLIGNKNLCGGIPLLQLPTCPNLESRKQGKPLSTKAIIAITVTGGVCLAFIVGFFIFYGRRKPKRKSTSTSSLGEVHLRVSYKELHEATGGFSSSSLLGVGSFGSVYKGILGEDERPIAVKVLNLYKHGASKSFMAECNAMRHIRHRNLLKILTSCSSVDFKGNEFLALVFEFMPKGNLENWLHQWRNLNLCQRLDIAIDVAMALDYLHHHCEIPIVHCDLKPSNILLDNDMVAHVGDFGLAKLLYEATGNFSKNQSNSSAIKGSIGYVAPEYGMGGKVSLQGDIYSYGILLLEMVTGKRPTDDMFKDGLSLHNFVETGLLQQVREIFDSCLLREFEEAATNARNGRELEGKMWECLVSIAGIGVSCSVEQPSERMDIKDAIKELHLIKKIFVPTGIHGEE